jgi:ribose transport system substrate-binding protein
MQQATNLKPDAILITGLPKEQATGPIADARKAGIPVFCVACGFQEAAASPPTKTGLTYEVSWDFGLQGKITAAQIVLDSKGTANVLMTSDPEFSSTRDRNAEASKVFSDCSGCKVSKTLTFNAADVATSLPAEMKAALQADPSIDYVWNPYDDPAMVANNAILQLGNKGKVFTTGVDANAPNVENIQSGGPQIGDNVVPLSWTAYAEIDNVNRYLNHAPMLTDNHIPYVLVTKTNAAGWANFGTGDVDVDAGYKALWGVS